MTWIVVMLAILCISLGVCCVLMATEIFKLRTEVFRLEDKASNYYMRLLGMVSEKDK